MTGRDFSDYYLGENVYELGGGVVPEMMGVFGVESGAEPNEVALQGLFMAMRENKVLQSNLPAVQATLGTDADAITIAAGWVDRSGVQEPLNRSLWTPWLSAPAEAVKVMRGNVANWTDRTGRLLLGEVVPGQKVVLLGGERVMDSATELPNPNISAFREANGGQSPTEAVYLREVIAPQLEEAGYGVSHVSLPTKSGDELVAGLFDRRPDLLKSDIEAVTVANAGVQFACQLRRAARQVKPQFDGRRPQVFMRTDTFPVARTESEAKNPREYQNPMTAIGQILQTAKQLFEVELP